MQSGGCTECAFACNNCRKVVDKDNGYYFENQEYCEDCYSHIFVSCETCGETMPNDDAFFEDDGVYCESCHNDKFTECHSCYAGTD